MKPIEQYFLVVLFIMLYKMVLSLRLEKKFYSVTIQNESLDEQYFPVLLFIVRCKVVATFQFVDEIQKCDSVFK